MGKYNFYFKLAAGFSFLFIFMYHGDIKLPAIILSIAVIGDAILEGLIEWKKNNLKN